MARVYFRIKNPRAPLHPIRIKIVVHHYNLEHITIVFSLPETSYPHIYSIISKLLSLFLVPSPGSDWLSPEIMSIRSSDFTSISFESPSAGSGWLDSCQAGIDGGTTGLFDTDGNCFLQPQNNYFPNSTFLTVTNRFKSSPFTADSSDLSSCKCRAGFRSSCPMRSTSTFTLVSDCLSSSTEAATDRCSSSTLSSILFLRPNKYGLINFWKNSPSCSVSKT